MKNGFRALFLIAILVISLSGLISSVDARGAGIDKAGSLGGGETRIVKPVWKAAPSKAQTNVLEEKIIGQLGGIIEGPRDSLLNGIKVEFPPGALPGDVKVSLGQNMGGITPKTGTASGIIIYLDTGPVVEFEQPVEITIPFSQPDAIPIPYYIDENDALHVMTILDIDRNNGTATFQTFHASLFTWVMDILGLTDKEDAYNCSYRPGNDGFQVRNRSSAYNRRGECFGMTTFSLWYYENHLNSGKFYPKFMCDLGVDTDGESIKGQSVIATRAFISSIQQWNSYIPTVTQHKNLTDEENYIVIRNAILNTDSPVLIYLYHIGGSGSAHSVLAYGYNRGDISIYDPNHPGATKTVKFDTSEKDFDSYSDFDGIVYNGDGSLYLTESYDNILKDAEEEFSGDGNASITLSSHSGGQQVNSRDITIAGTIQSSQVSVEKLSIMVGSTEFKTNVPESGNFSLEVAVEQGVNHLFFNTSGSDNDGIMIDLPNNLQGKDFTLYGGFESSVILVTLTWDTNDTDLDLYVVDPADDYSCYYHKNTSDGGELDIDITDGYGPEHWTLSCDDIIRYGGNYVVRVHYFSNHGHGPSNYTVTILTGEGTPSETSTTYRGNLSACNPSNKAPHCTGSDWAYIDTISLGRAP